MMHVRGMRVPVLQSLVPVGMGVRLAGRIIGGVDVLVVLVMHVRMRMLHRLMHMLVLVVLGEMQPDTDGHQQAGDKQLTVNGSSRSASAAIAPMNGAVEK
jgi:hypothetical protein